MSQQAGMGGMGMGGMGQAGWGGAGMNPANTGGLDFSRLFAAGKIKVQYLIEINCFQVCYFRCGYFEG